MTTTTVNRYASEDKKIPSMPLAAWTIVPSDTGVYDQPVHIRCLTAGTLEVKPFAGGIDGSRTGWLSETMTVGQILDYAVCAVKATSITGTYRGTF
jgi:hypothetical protein